MIKVVLQKICSGNRVDNILYDKDNIIINEKTFSFKKGKNIYFKSMPEEGIVDIYRDGSGELQGTVRKRVLDHNNESNNMIKQHKKISIKTQNSIVVSENFKINILKIETEIKKLQENYINASILDDSILQEKIKIKIKKLTQELVDGREKNTHSGME